MNIYEQKKMRWVVYKATNEIDGKIYIGKSGRFRDRFRTHINDPFNENSKEYGKYFYNAIRKHSSEVFKWEILYMSLDEDDAYIIENDFILFYESYNREIGYNILKGQKGGKANYCFNNEKENREKGYAKLKELYKDGFPPEIFKKCMEAREQYWKIVDPNGNILIVKNLNKFSKEKDLNHRNLILVSQGKRAHHKNYTCQRLHKPVFYDRNFYTDYSKILSDYTNVFNSLEWYELDILTGGVLTMDKNFKLEIPFKKQFKITFKNEEFIIYDFKRFCNERNLNHELMKRVYQNVQYNSYKGYKCELIKIPLY